jgi:hypothetical protein
MERLDLIWLFYSAAFGIICAVFMTATFGLFVSYHTVMALAAYVGG